MLRRWKPGNRVVIQFGSLHPIERRATVVRVKRSNVYYVLDGTDKVRNTAEQGTVVG